MIYHNLVEPRYILLDVTTTDNPFSFFNLVDFPKEKSTM